MKYPDVVTGMTPDPKIMIPECNLGGSTTPAGPEDKVTPGNMKALMAPIETTHQGVGPGWNTKRPKSVDSESADMS